MPTRPLEPDQLESLVDTRDPVTGLTYPRAGLTPYHDWLIETLHLLAASSLGHLRVSRDAASATAVCIAPGRAEIGGVATAFGGATLDRASMNNDTVLVWLAESHGIGQAGAAATAAGWPTDAHLKLAEVTLDAGRVTAIVDRRLEAVFRAP